MTLPLRRCALALILTAPVFAETPPLPTKLPAGLKANLFAAPPMVNYPTFVAAAANGDLYVSVDKNGSLDTKADRGFIYKLVDKNGDGVADERTIFAQPVTSPRGLAVVGNAVICLHPPELEAFWDRDGDGIAEERKVLVKGIGFDLSKRPPDHTSNGVTLGIDGWLYLAMGDFGFMEAEGTDGAKFQLRGGGVVRVRPDGSGMELYAGGTRNIYEVAVDPWLNLFARDNTNDGGGWDTRVEFYLGGVDLGYPRKFLHFTDETFPVLGIFGGGSGVGGTYVQERGFGWPAGYDDVLYTCDWGRSEVYRHELKDQGASFSVTQDTLLQLERVTDMKMDALGNAYVASWKGATFSYAGEEVGYIARISAEKPTGKVVNVDFAKKPPEALVADLTNPDSHMLRLSAQQEILHRSKPAEFVPLLQKAAEADGNVPGRIAAIFALKQLSHAECHPFLLKLLADSKVKEFVLRALADVPKEGTMVPTEALSAALGDPNDHVKAQAAIALSRLHRPDAAPALLALAAQAQEAGATTDAIKPKATTGVIRRSTPGHREKLEADITDGKTLYLVVTVGQDTFNLDHADWMEPKLSGPAGEKKLTELPWKSATQGWGSTMVNKTHSGGTLKVDGKEIPFGIGTHSPSVIAYDLPPGFTKFSASGGLDDTSASQGDTGSVEFQIYVDELPESLRGSTTKIETLYTDTTRALPHVASQALIKLAAADACLQALDSDAAMHPAALRVLRQLHQPEVVSALLDRLGKASEPALQRGLLTALVRLFNQEGPWDGSSWGTRPDTSGPYYNRGPWSETPRIEQALREFANHAGPALKQHLLQELVLHSVTISGIENASQGVDPQWVKDQETLLGALQNTAKMQPGDIGLMEPQAAMEEALKILGEQKADAVRGQKVFIQQGCIACHVVGKNDPPKGPNLFDIALRYKPQEIMTSILNPSATVVQGFPTQIITTKDGQMVSGFAIREASEGITIRNMAAVTQLIATKDIAKHEKDEHVSSMTPGLLNNVTPLALADLVRYFQSLK